MFFIFLAELAGGILAYVYRAEARTFVVDGLGRTIRDFYGRNDTSTADAVTTAVNQIQQRVRVSRAGAPLPPLTLSSPPLLCSSSVAGWATAPTSTVSGTVCRGRARSPPPAVARSRTTLYWHASPKASSMR